MFRINKFIIKLLICVKNYFSPWSSNWLLEFFFSKSSSKFGRYCVSYYYCHFFHFWSEIRVLILYLLYPYFIFILIRFSQFFSKHINIYIYWIYLTTLTIYTFCIWIMGIQCVLIANVFTYSNNLSSFRKATDGQCKTNNIMNIWYKIKYAL